MITLKIVIIVFLVTIAIAIWSRSGLVGAMIGISVGAVLYSIIPSHENSYDS